ncbi:hypothetical protein [Streptomyces roseolilacinus]|uniref:Uncharacterized protein n=1 Tax=Streptomyces roseolilacinus TaxID=66904 RepID=A0A918AYC1_9ACTN|nr:hypothetical protein [Streptomyces roseolilacinus]GGQ01034.1 hypothetical protein GCM10010249_19190 [Streptomyces roseolilacinus]
MSHGIPTPRRMLRITRRWAAAVVLGVPLADRGTPTAAGTGREVAGEG